GLDKIIKIDFSLQLAIFQKHIVISERLKKPLIIHCVKAYNEILSLHKKLQPSQNWLVHGFRANTQIALQLQEKGIYLSFGEALLKSPKLQETFAQIQPEYLFLETDDSGISIEKIYEIAAQIRKINVKELQKQIKQNLCKFFSEKNTIF
ncbi:MAG: TatD family hydrolase, partial [Raineya sp.]